MRSSRRAQGPDAFPPGRGGQPAGKRGRIADLVQSAHELQPDGLVHVFGVSPRYEDLNWTGLDFSAEQFNTVTSIDKAAWQAELKLHAELFQQLAHHLPKELPATKAAIEQRLAA